MGLLLHALRNRSFRLLWWGQTVSRLGDSLHRFALVWWVLQTTGSGLAMGTVVICQTLPLLVFLLVGGVYVDRFSRIRIMLASDLARGVITGWIAFMAVTGQLEVWHIYVASVIFGLVDAFFQPAYSAVVPAILSPEELPSANSLSMLSGQLTNIVGPMLGALLVGLGGTSLAFVLDASSFFISAVCLVPLLGLWIKLPKRGPSDRGAWHEMREGFAVITKEPWLSITIASTAFLNATDYCAFIVTLPFMITRTMDLDASTLGVVQSLYSVGTVGGAIWLGRRARLRRRGLVVYGLAIGLGLCTVLFGMPITIYGIAAVVLVRGIALAINSLVFLNTMQEMVPSDTMGRVSSIDWFVSGLLMPIGFAVIGWATDHFSPSAIFVVIGVSSMSLALIALIHPRIRTLD
ncbi:MAG: major facilitator superfamily 1, partial [Deltaproteobacteria bacterium]|nr:major facilitator superfamily 1 [Deltaproteobacteria bacterium]